MASPGSVFNYAKGDYSEMDCYLMEKQFDSSFINIEELWMSLKSEILDAWKLLYQKLNFCLVNILDVSTQKSSTF